MPAVKKGEPYYVVGGKKYTESELSKKSLQEQTLIKLAAQEEAYPTAAKVHAQLYGGTAGAAFESAQFWEKYNQEVVDLTESYKEARQAGDLALAKTLWERGISKYSVDVHREMSIVPGTKVVYPKRFWEPAAPIETVMPGPTSQLATSMFPPGAGVEPLVDPASRAAPAPFAYQQDVTVPPPPTPYAPPVPAAALKAGPVYDPLSIAYYKKFEEEMKRTPREAYAYEFERQRGVTSEWLATRYEALKSRIGEGTRETPISIDIADRDFQLTAQAENIPLFTGALLGGYLIGGKEGLIDPLIATVTDPLGTGEAMFTGGIEAATNPLGFLEGVSFFLHEKTAAYGPSYIPGFLTGMYSQTKVYGKGFQLAAGGVRTIAHVPYYLEGPWKWGKIHLEQKVLTRVRGKVPAPAKVDIPFKQGTRARSLYDAVSRRFKATTGGSISTEMLVGKKLPRHKFKFSKDLDLVFSSLDDYDDAYAYLVKHGARDAPGGGVFVREGERWWHWDMHVEPGHGYTTIGGRRVLSYREQLFRKGPKTMLDPEEWSRAGLDIPGRHVRTFREFKRARGRARPELIYAKDAMDFPFLVDEMLGQATDYTKVLKASWLDDFTVQVTGGRAKQVRLVAKTKRGVARLERAERAARVSAEASEVLESASSAASIVSSSASMAAASLSSLRGARPSKVSRPSRARAPSEPSTREVVDLQVASMPLDVLDLRAALSAALPSERRGYPRLRGVRAPSRPSPSMRESYVSGPVDEMLVAVSSVARASEPRVPPAREAVASGYEALLADALGPFTGRPAPRRREDREKRREEERRAARRREYEYRGSIWGWLVGAEVEEPLDPLYWTGFAARPVVRKKKKERKK